HGAHSRAVAEVGGPSRTGARHQPKPSRRPCAGAGRQRPRGLDTGIPGAAAERGPGHERGRRRVTRRREAGAALEETAGPVIYVLDTNAVSALMKGSAAVVERLAATEPAAVSVPQPVFAEIAFGIERLPRSRRRAALQERFDLISSELPRAA